ncbi:HER100Wp [Eremothecium sinecaudum]|uniref:HER100Wp n=1 Tax=Eremothecium sinecaudum TaxID=45286 RepID=A0A0X8HTX5_9SACH|nr:HER100Wp [Eremothecium sinecaudum]AMD21379.1 HER100Wp [Eremothecium sinecaudum]
MPEVPKTPAKRRSAAKRINYDEKRADAELLQRIKQLEKNKPKSSNKAVVKAKTQGFKYQGFLQDKATPWNFIPTLPPAFRKHSRFSNVIDIQDAYVDTRTQSLYNGSSVVLKRDDHIYMISEPPGEPYYIGRVVEFIPKTEFYESIESARKMDITQSFPAKYFQVKMNWYYRARDIRDNASNVNSRLLYASLHNDICPIQSYRGKCTVLHKSELEDGNIHEYINKPGNFFFEQVFDRYTLTYYDVWSTKELLNLKIDSKFLIALSERYPYIYVEEKFPVINVIKRYILNDESSIDNQSGQWDLQCGRCEEWCEQVNSIKCDACKTPLHLYCLDPPLERKPGKRISWICFACIQSQNDSFTEIDQSKTNILAATEVETKSLVGKGRNIENWWFQYFGSKLICHLEDCITTDLILPYPIKCSRIGVRRQWSGCNDLEWVPKPYSDSEDERGLDSTSALLWYLDKKAISEQELDEYVERCSDNFPKNLGITPQATNFLDMIVKILVDNGFQRDEAFKKCGKVISRESLKEPTFSKEEVEKFEQAVADHGSELYPVCKFVGTQPMSMIVRFYYNWKKTENGRKIWGNFKGRSKNKNKNKITAQGSATGKELEDLRKRKRKTPDKLDDLEPQWKHVDDSSFDSEKINKVKTCFQCMFCEIDYSPLWYRVTGGSDDENVQSRMKVGVNEKTIVSGKSSSRLSPPQEQKLNALCIRCARLWRRYAVKWQPPIEVLKKLKGSSTSNMQTALIELLDDPNEKLIKSCPSQALTKMLEWELVQDAELIVKQRYDMLKNPDRLNKIKRNCLSAHGQLNKLVKRPITSIAKDSGGAKELTAYIDKHSAGLRRKERKLKEVNGTSALKLPVTKDKPAPLVATANNPIQDAEGSANVVQAEPIVKKRKYNSSQKNSFGNGTIKLEIPGLCDSKSGKQITIENQFEFIKIPEEVHNNLFGKLMGNSSHNKHKASEATRSAAVDNKLIQLNRSLSFNDSGVSIIRQSQLYDGILREYNSINPVYCKENNRAVLQGSGSSKFSGSTKSSLQTAGRKSKSNLSSLVDLSTQVIGEPRDFCCICMGDFNQPENLELTCCNCGLNVHPDCYGVNNTSNIESGENSWLCDSCSNDRNPLVSTNYQCSLCNAREIDHNSAKRKLKKAIPDALKFDMSGSWCHVICAIFNPDVKFGLPKTYQPLYNIGTVLLKNDGEKCGICSFQGGGLVQCDKCSNKFHVTCAQDTPDFRLCFKKYSEPSAYNTGPNSNEKFNIKPIIVCAHHSKQSDSMKDTLPLDSRTSSGVSLVQHYIKNYKTLSTINGYSSIGLRIQEYETYCKLNAENGNQDGMVKAECKDNVCLSSNKKCIHCATAVSIYWYNNVCHGCYISKDDINYISKEKTDIVVEHPAVDFNLSKHLLQDIDCDKLRIEINFQPGTKPRRKGTKNPKKPSPANEDGSPNVVVQDMGTNLTLVKDQSFSETETDFPKTMD